MTPVEAALRYITAGVMIYPAGGENGKERIKGYKSRRAIRDADKARNCFEREHPGANIGIVCGASGLAVVDCDERNGGRETFDDLCADIGCDWFRGCPVVITPSNGLHVYFRTDGVRVPGGSNKLGPGLDVLTQQSGVIAPPSTRPDGAYRWICGFPDPFSPPPFPSVLLERIATQKPERAAAKALQRKVARTTPQIIHAGSRNTTLTRLAGRQMRFMASNEATLEAFLQAVNKTQCEPPLPQSEVTMIAHSIATTHYGPSVLPILWLEGWIPEFSPTGEAKVALALYAMAERSGLMTLTPAEKAVCDIAKVDRSTYYRGRARMQERGAIRVTERGRKNAPIIELLPRAS